MWYFVFTLKCHKCTYKSLGLSERIIKKKTIANQEKLRNKSSHTLQPHFFSSCICFGLFCCLSIEILMYTFWVSEMNRKKVFIIVFKAKKNQYRLNVFYLRCYGFVYVCIICFFSLRSEQKLNSGCLCLFHICVHMFWKRNTYACRQIFIFVLLNKHGWSVRLKMWVSVLYCICKSVCASMY